MAACCSCNNLIRFKFYRKFYCKFYCSCDQSITVAVGRFYLEYSDPGEPDVVERDGASKWIAAGRLADGEVSVPVDAASGHGCRAVRHVVCRWRA